MTITYEQYVGKWKDSEDLTPERINNAKNILLPAVEALEAYMILQGVDFPINPVTKSQISGQTFGGFRPQSCPQGAPKSPHKDGLGVDRYDPLNEIDNWLLAHQEVLVEFGVYIEHPDKTPHWSHWTTRPPKSGKHVFYP